jgi:thiol:disulfide interchange protein DsbD
MSWILSLLLLQDEAPARLVPPVTADRAELRAGETVKLTLDVDVDPGWHIYSANDKKLSTTFEFEKMPVEIAGPIEEPPPHPYEMKELGETYQVHEGKRVRFVVPLKITTAARPGDLELKGTIGPQVCDDKHCITWYEDFTVKLKILQAAPKAATHARVAGPVALSPAEARPGDLIKLTVVVETDKGWHIYSANEPETRTEFEFEGPVRIEGRIEEPKPHPYKMKGVEETFQVHEGRITFVVPLRIDPKAAPGETNLKGKIGPQVCNDRSCVTWSEEIAATLKILPGAAPAPQPEKPAEDKLFGGGLFAFLGLCVLGGLISLVMPCVYPMIPITVSYFLKQADKDRGKTALLSFAYAVGIIASFTILGMVLSIALGEGGAQAFAVNPWVNLAIGIVFSIFALSLLGAFEIALPGFLTTAVTGPARSGVIGALFLGLTFSVVSFTCVIPIAGSLLAGAATGKAAWALLGMLVYSATMAVPFIALGAFPQLLAKIPKSGGWLHNAKVVAGFLEIALAMAYFAKADFAWGFDLISRNMGIIVWTACAALSGFYILGLFRMKEDTPVEHVGISRALLAFTFVCLAMFTASGVNDQHLGAFEFMLPYSPVIAEGGRDVVLERRFKELQQGGRGGPQVNGLSGDYLKDYDEGLRIAREKAAPIFIDFTGFN